MVFVLLPLPCIGACGLYCSDNPTRVEDHFTAINLRCIECLYGYHEEIHEDVFKIMKYSCEEICSTKDQLNNVLRFWALFLERVLGVHSRPHGSETIEDMDATKAWTTKNTTADMMDSESSQIVDVTTTKLKQVKSNCNGDTNASPPR